MNNLTQSGMNRRQLIGTGLLVGAGLFVPHAKAEEETNEMTDAEWQERAKTGDFTFQSDTAPWDEVSAIRLHVEMKELSPIVEKTQTHGVVELGLTDTTTGEEWSWHDFVITKSKANSWMATMFVTGPQGASDTMNPKPKWMPVDLSKFAFTVDTSIKKNATASITFLSGEKVDLADRGCFLTTACTLVRGLSDDCMELQTLRDFRDGYMRIQCREGAALVRQYYAEAPRVVAAIDALDCRRDVYDWMYRDLVLPSVRMVHNGMPAKALDHYGSFFSNLQGSMSRF
jgi:hypothetical protein